MSYLLILGALLSTALLVVDLGLGWAAARATRNTTLHINLAFVATIAVLFSQAMVLFYLLGSVRRVKQVVRDQGISLQLTPHLPTPRSVLPLASLAIPAVMGAFILGGGAHTGAIAPWLHGALAILAVLLQAGSATQQVRALLSLEQGIQKVEQVMES